MVDQFYDLIFHFKGCGMRKVGSRILVENAIKCLNNVYVLSEIKRKAKYSMGVISLTSNQ